MKGFIKAIFLILLFHSMWFKVYAISVSDFWKNMPDSVMDRKVYGMQSVVDTLTDNFIQVTLSSHSSLQIKRLPALTGDSLFCIVRTYGSEAKESEIALYRSDYSMVRMLEYNPNDIIRKAGDIDDKRFDDIRGEIVLSLVNATLSVDDDDTMILNVGFPFLFKEEKKDFESLILQKTVKWNGETFK